MRVVIGSTVLRVFVTSSPSAGPSDQKTPRGAAVPVGGLPACLAKERSLKGASSDRRARLPNLRLSVIGAVDGPTSGASFALALSADVILAHRGLLPAVPANRRIADMIFIRMLARAIGALKWKELLLTGRKITAEAGELRFVRSAYEADQLQGGDCAMARRFLDAPQEMIHITKRLGEPHVRNRRRSTRRTRDSSPGGVHRDRNTRSPCSASYATDPVLCNWGGE